MAALLVWLVTAWAAPNGLELQERSTDWAWRMFAKTQDERRLVLIDIDEKSLREVGPWPWPRPIQARLVDRLAKEGAALIVLDVVFADPRPDDAVLEQAVRAHGPVLAQVFALPGQGDDTETGTLAGALAWPACAAPFEAATGYLANQSALAAAAPAVGHITPQVGADGVVRHQAAVLCHQGRAYPALALAALMRATGERNPVLQPGPSPWSSAWQLVSAQGSFAPLPLDTQGRIRLPWRQHQDSFLSLSAADVLAGRVPAALLDKAWVLVGGSAFGLSDTIATPFGGASAGMLAHAGLMTAALDGRLPYTPRLQGALQFAAIAGGMGLLGLLALASSRRRRPADERLARHRLGGWLGRGLPAQAMPLVALAYGALLWWGHAMLLVHADWWVGWLQPALAVLAAGLAWGVVDHTRSRIERDRLFSHLSSYLPAPVAASLALQPPSSAIRAATRQVSVLFADIRNFSAYCEARPAEEAAAVLHAFFSTAARAIQAEGGVIESFQGDAVVAVWYGEVAPSGAGADGGARSALKAAVALQQAMQGVLPDPAPAGLEPLALGIGLESGPAMAGSFGLSSRRTHLVLGRTVTIANRLVGMTADLAHPILVGEGLAAQVGRAGLVSMGTFLLEGLRVPHHVYAYPLQSAPRLPD